jgi:hypothetical protein
MNSYKERLKQEFNENPMGVIGAAALALTAVAKVIDAASASQGRRAYAKQVSFRTRGR